MNSWVNLLFSASVHKKNNDIFSVSYVCVYMLVREEGSQVHLSYSLAYKCIVGAKPIRRNGNIKSCVNIAVKKGSSTQNGHILSPEKVH